MNRRIVFAHGFTQTGRSWRHIANGLQGGLDHVATLDLIAPDLPGHGDASEQRSDLWQCGEMLASVGQAAAYIGYSMGGRVALHTALRHPDLVQKLVLIGATAGIVDDAERAARRVSDNELADHIIEYGVPAFVDDWLTKPLFAGLDDDSSMREDRLRNTPDGLASSLRLAGTGTQQPLWDQLSGIDCPVLVLVGEHDAKFTALGEQLVAGLSHARLGVISGAGHSVHLEQPAATVEALIDFLG
ncbi:MAG: alpha/beta fold hydrolase [Ilumatobacter sp.]